MGENIPQSCNLQGKLHSQYYHVPCLVCDGSILCEQGEDEDFELCKSTFPKEASLRDIFMLAKQFSLIRDGIFQTPPKLGFLY